MIVTIWGAKYIYRNLYVRKNKTNEGGWYINPHPTYLGLVKARTIKELKQKIDNLLDANSVKFILE